MAGKRFLVSKQRVHITCFIHAPPCLRRDSWGSQTAGPAVWFRPWDHFLLLDECPELFCKLTSRLPRCLRGPDQDPCFFCSALRPPQASSLLALPRAPWFLCLCHSHSGSWWLLLEPRSCFLREATKPACLGDCGHVDGSPPYFVLCVAGTSVYIGLKVSEVAQSYPALCDPVDCSPPGSSIHGIF